ncbi:MAG: LysR family transcriptional regulator [Lacisediminihabitans sp.]
MPELSALRMLHVVRESGSFSAAGAAIGLSQQAVSSRMLALERLLGIRLFERSPSGSSLTASGALIADWADEVLSAAERMEAGIASLGSERAASLRVVASQTIAEHLMPKWMVMLRRQQTADGRSVTPIELSVSNSRAAADAVRDGTAAIGFIETPMLPTGLVSKTIRTDEMAVVVAPDHPWTRLRHPLTAGELARTPLVMRELGSGTREALEWMVATELPDAPTLVPAIELSTSAAVRSAIASGLAPGVLSVLAVQDDLVLERLVRVPVEGLSLRRPLSVIWKRSSGTPDGAAAELVAIAARRRN